MATIRLGTAYIVLIAILLLMILDSLIQLFAPIIIPDIDWTIFSFTEWLIGVVSAGAEFIFQLIKLPFVILGFIATVITLNEALDEIVLGLELGLGVVVAFIGVFIELAAISVTTIVLKWIFGGGEIHPPKGLISENI